MSFVPADFWPPGPPTGAAAVDQTARDAAAAAQATASAALPATDPALTAAIPGTKATWLGAMAGELLVSLASFIAREVDPGSFGAIGDAVTHPVGAAPMSGSYADIWALRAVLPVKFTSLADAAATSFVPWTAAGTALVVLGADSARITYSTVANTLTIDSQSAGAVFAAATGVLTGTSGAAGKVSLSVAGGLFYIENRRG